MILNFFLITVLLFFIFMGMGLVYIFYCQIKDEITELKKKGNEAVIE